jgi:CPA2 family monovalent cation:H+ antiporter-2
MNWSIAQIELIVLCAMGSGLVLSALGHSPILGYIVAGVILGPSGFQFINDRAGVGIFSEMGILFLLFAIGLSLSFEKVKNMWKTSVVATVLSTVFIYFVIFIIGLFLRLSLGQIIFATFFLTLSSTAVTVKSLKGLKGDHYEDIHANTLGILIVQDLAALAMVIVINIIGVKSADHSAIYQPITVLLLIALGMFYFLRSHYFIHHLERFFKKHEEMMSMCVFGLCLGSAVLAEIAGLSAAFGSFVAGLILGNSSIKEKVQGAAAPIEELLLMTFFLSIGLLVDLGYIANHIMSIFLGLLLITVGKTIINIFVMRICRFPLKQSFVISVLLAHTGEFSFMLCYAASKVGIVDANVVKFLISLTVASLFLSPFWLSFAQRCLAMTENSEILSSLDFSRLALDKEIRKMKRAIAYVVRPFSDSAINHSVKTMETMENIPDEESKHDQ